MDELRESSLLFSLEGLLETERERVQREAREAQRRREEELGRVAELAERRRTQAQQEREARERLAALEAERQRMEQQQLDATKCATVERTRIQAEAELRLIEVEQARKHDLALAKIQAERLTGRYLTLTWLSSGAFVAAVICGAAAYFGWILPAEAQTSQQLQSVVKTSVEHAKESERALSNEQSRNRTLSERVRQLEARVMVLAATPTLVTEPKAQHGSNGSVKPPRPPTTLHKRCRDTGDPLDDCLGAGRAR